jgi:hypothetical protein
VLLNLSLILIVRLFQRTSILSINTSKISNLNMPAYHSFKVLKFCFGFVVGMNSFLLSEEFTLQTVALYIIYFIPCVAWWNIFYELHFKRAGTYALGSLKTLIILAFFDRNWFWSVSIAWAAIILYLPSYYYYCLPT